MTMIRSVVLGALLGMVSACGSSDDEPTMCAPRSGLFEATSKTTSGNCGDLSKIVLSPEEIDGPAKGCAVNSQTIEPSGCQVLLDLRCKLDDGSMMNVRRHVKWNAAGTSATGSVLIDISGPTGTCSGGYDLSYRKT